MEIKFKRDTSFRKQFFVPDSFAHPAKMDAQLLIWIVERYTKLGEIILDPMAGSGTTMLACTLSRNVVLVELEDKFCKMMRDNWEQVKMRPQLGSTMGSCEIIQGDARQLGGLLGCTMDGSGSPPLERHSGELKPTSPSPQVDKIVTSPPYAESQIGDDRKTYNPAHYGITVDGKRRGGSLIDKYKVFDNNPNNIGNLPYGEIDKCIFSPPYAETKSAQDVQFQKKLTEDKHSSLFGRNPKGSFFNEKTTENPDAIGNLPYGQIDKIVTSPPFAVTVGGAKASDEFIEKWEAKHGKRIKGALHRMEEWFYPEANNKSIGGSRTKKSVSERASNRNIGNINIMGNKGRLMMGSYLEAMLQVYQSCFAVLKYGGLMVLVTKNFIRNKQVVRLDTDTIKLCEQAGFSFVERHYRELPSQSFWRVIYHQKFPDVEQILNEDILVFRK